MFWLPPVRFSTTTGCFQVSCRFAASVRAIVSGEPPGGSGTMIFNARSGNPWAKVTEETSAAAAATIQRFTFPPRLLQRAVYLRNGPEYDGLSQRRSTHHADPRGARAAARRRVVVPVP